MRRVLVLVGIAFAIHAGPARAVIFSDDFESGNMSNWTQYPGSAAALAINGPDSTKNHDPVGGLYSARQSPLVAGGNGISSYHDFGNQSGFLKVEVWMFEDFSSTQDPIHTGITLQTKNGSGVPNFSDYFRIGVSQFSGSNTVYAYRTPAGTFATSVARKSGWTKLGIEVDAGVGSQARFYIDDALVGTGVRSAADLSIISLGMNFSNFENAWYDGVSVVPEPSSLIIAGLGGLGIVGYVARRRSRKA
jgi:hypothetical protein